MIQLWQIPQEPTTNLVFYTNPPFGTSSTNKLASKIFEINEAGFRQMNIQYGGLDRKYGKGDIILPAIGKILELIKTMGFGSIAFFSPSGLFLEHTRYNKILKELFRIFNFLKERSLQVAHLKKSQKAKAIAFTIWQYMPESNTPHDSLSFLYEGRRIPLKQCQLIKDVWRYRDGSLYVQNKTENALGVLRCDRYNSPNPKVFSINVKDGSGATLSPRM